MNYAFKMMAVVLALGVLVLSGCQTSQSIILPPTNWNQLSDYKKERLRSANNKTVCKYSNDEEWISEARRRGLDCRDNFTKPNVNKLKTSKIAGNEFYWIKHNRQYTRYRL